MMHARKGMLLLSLLVAFAAGAAERLTNSDVIAWQQAKLGDAIMLAKIRSARAAFDTGTEGLVALKAAGVSDTVIAAMVEASATPATAAEMELQLDADSRPMAAVALNAESSSRKDWIPYYSGAPETFFFFDGPHAALQVAQVRPVFVSALPPDRVKLVHLGQHEGRKTRFIVFAGANSDRSVGMGAKQLDDGRYEYRPQADLEAGEYALMVSPDLENDANTPAMMRGMMGMVRSRMALFTKAYDFAVMPAAGASATAAGL